MKFSYKSQFNTYSLGFLVYTFIFYLIFFTGYFSDDFSEINRINENNNQVSAIPTFNYVNMPVLYYTHYLFYYFVDYDNIFFISTIKFLYTAICCYMVSKFFSLFVDSRNALIISFLFIFWPTHDSTVYWLLGQYLMITMSFYLYSYYLIEKEFIFNGILMAFLASFISYGSSPVAISLAILFIFNKKIKKSFFLIFPNIIYIVYYILVSKVFAISSVSRIPDSIQFISLIKNLIFQIISSLDSNFGIGFILKLYYSIGELKITSALMGLFILLIYFVIENNKNVKKTYKEIFDFKLIFALTLIILSSMLMFAVSGGYFQTPFNLGNRVLIYSSLLLSYIIIVFYKNYPSIYIKIFLVIIFFSIIGISSHWKSQTERQLDVINNIERNNVFSQISHEQILFVTGNQYSQFGKISHIEFFSESHVAEASVGIAGQRLLKVKTLNNAWDFDGLILQDRKYKHRNYEVEDSIHIYDSEKNIFTVIPTNQISFFIETLPKNKRHWIQLIQIRQLQNLINNNFPRLKYLF